MEGKLDLARPVRRGITPTTRIGGQVQPAPVARIGQGRLDFQTRGPPLVIQGEPQPGQEAARRGGGLLPPINLTSRHLQAPQIKEMPQGGSNITPATDRNTADDQLTIGVSLQLQARPLDHQGLEPGFAGRQARREIDIQMQARQPGLRGGVRRVPQDHLLQGEARGQARQSQVQAFAGHLCAQRRRQGRHQWGTQPVDVPQSQGHPQGQPRH